MLSILDQAFKGEAQDDMFLSSFFVDFAQALELRRDKSNRNH
jgi:hypothetical protein